MGNLWWLEPGWKETLCADCGMKIWPEGDPDHGVCVTCWNRRYNDQQHEREYNEQLEREYHASLQAEPQGGGEWMSDEQQVYLQGIIDGLEAFAFWKDGTQYVGTCGMTLKEAKEKAKQGKLFGMRQFGNDWKPATTPPQAQEG